MKTKKHRIEGASMDRIEELASAINYRTPDWVPYIVAIEGTETSSLDAAMVETQHFSGLLRDCARSAGTALLEDENGITHDLETLLDDAAERLDQAHQEWLEAQARTNTLEAGLAAGVEAVQALIDNPRRAAISGLEDWATRAGDELPDAAADPQPAITILWGECPQPEDEPVTYTFNTDAELQAFIDGIEAGDGWMNYEVKS